MEKMTKRNVYEALINLGTNGNLTYTTDEGEVEITGEDLVAFAENEISLLDKKAVKAKERAAAKRAEGDALTEAVFNVLTEEFEPIADITVRVEGEDVSLAKVGYRLRTLAAAGRAEKTELTIPATETSKTRKVVGYRKV